VPTRKLFAPISPLFWSLCLAGLAVIAALYRTLQWNQLPPGLATAEAESGLLSRNIAAGHQSIGFHASTGFSPLWELLQALSISLFGSTINALRIVALVIGLAAVATTYGWARSWYDRRTAWVAAFLMAVVPWSLTLSRNALPTVLAPLVITSLLWAMTGVMRNPSSITRIVCLLAVVLLALISGPWGWLSLVIVAVAVSFQRKLLRRAFKSLNSYRVILITGSIITIAAIVLTATLSVRSFHILLSAYGIAHGSAVVSSVFRTLSMFFYYGDPDFHHNLGGEPMLNAFIALAFATGLLLSLSRFQRARDRILLVILFLGLLPAMLSGGLIPNAARAALALPVILT
jgi:4-amino-4-deoxy-L-arabinose transferase-like glycosyltransferase